MNNPIDTISNFDLLENLVQKNLEAAKGYETAATGVTNLTLRNFFYEKAIERKSFSEELEKLILHNGGTVDTSPGILSGIHRTWMEAKAVLTANDEIAMLNECIRGENLILDEYQNILKKGEISDQVENVLSQQKAKVIQASLDLDTFKSQLTVKVY